VRQVSPGATTDLPTKKCLRRVGADKVGVSLADAGEELGRSKP